MDLVAISVPPIDFIEDIDVYCYTATAIISVPHNSRFPYRYHPYYDYDYDDWRYRYYEIVTVGVIGNLTLQTTGRGNMSITASTDSGSVLNTSMVIVIVILIIGVLTTVIIIIIILVRFWNKHHLQPVISIEIQVSIMMITI